MSQKKNSKRKKSVREAEIPKVVFGKEEEEQF